MAEYRKRDFSQFARDFFLYSTYFPLYLKERESLHPKVFMLHTKCVAFEISSAFNTYMREHVFEKAKDVVLRTDEDLLRFLVPRCAKLCHPEYHKSLIVAMAFIHEFLLYFQMNRLCYRFHFTAYKCLLATFKREYHRYWGKMDGWRGFQDEVKKTILRIRPYGERDVFGAFFEKKKFYDELKQLLENCNSVEEFVLNDYERALIAQHSVRGFVNNPRAKNPLKFNMSPAPRTMARKVIAFYKGKDYEFGIPIASLIPVPPYSKPEVDSDLDSSDDVDSDDSSPDIEIDNSDSQPEVDSNLDCDSSDDTDSDDSYPDLELDLDYSYDDDYESCFETREFSSFEIYTSLMMSEALNRDGAVKFRENMMQRKCKNCGITCYKFSYDLFKKQLGSAVVRS